MEKEVIIKNKDNTLENSNAKKRGIKDIIKDYIFIVPVILVLIILFSTVLTLGHIPSPSMYPTLDVGSGFFAVMIDKNDIYHGEIVIFHPNEEEGTSHELWIKRIIGLPGDTVKLEGDCVYINGELIDEPYINTESEILYESETFKVPEDHVFVMGDNRNDSFDSRYWERTYLPIGNLTSKPMLTFPMTPKCSSGFKRLNNEDFAE